MKTRRNIFIGFVLGICVTGAICLLYLPFIAGKGTFVTGFIAGLTFVACVIMAILISGKYFATIRESSEGIQPQAPGNKIQSLTFRRIIVPFIIISGGTWLSVMLYHQQQMLSNRWKVEHLQMEQQAALIESTRQSGLVNLMSNLLDSVDDELEKNPDRTLSAETIARISALSSSFVAYRQVHKDSLSTRRLSPERGQLLLMLSKMHIDSASIHQIMVQTSFANAILRGADLRDAALRNADLKRADLKDIQLQGASLQAADLQSATLWGANLSNADLSGAVLKTADLQWAIMNGTKMIKADLNGADMASAQLRKADMTGADLHFADFEGAVLKDAILTGANMNSANMKSAQLEICIVREANLTSAHLNEANLTGADLTGATLSLANMTGADLTDAILTGVIVTDKNWLTRLAEWGVTGAKEIEGKYKIVDLSTTQKTQYRLELKQD